MKRTGRLARKTPLRRTGRLNPKPGKPKGTLQRAKAWLERHTPLRKRSAKTGGHRFPKGVDEAFRKYVRGLPCVLARISTHICWGPVRACHVRTRASGGPDDSNLFPACDRAHDTQHLMGIKSFQRAFLLDLAAITRRTWDAYRETNLNTED